MKATQQEGRKRSLWRRVLASVLAIGLGLGGAVIATSAAHATHPTVSGSASCTPDAGTWTVTWTIGGDTGYPDETATIVSQSRPTTPTLVGQSVQNTGTVSATEVVSTTGKLDMIVEVQWTNHSQGDLVSKKGSVTIDGDCGDGDSKKITYCHATGSDSNPYEKIETSVNAFYVSGHIDHSGDIYPAGSFVKNGQTYSWGAQGDLSLLAYPDCAEPEPEVNFCDRADKPGGVSIAQWLQNNGINPADCFEYELVQQCGQFDVDITKAPVGISYGFQYALGANQDTVYPGLSLPAVFSEDEGGGSVQITIWMVGGESDYVRGTDIPNLWDNNGLTITIDTDCAPPAEGDYPTVTVIGEYCEYEDGSVVGGSISVDGGEDIQSFTVYDENMVEQTDLTNLPVGEYTVVVVFNDGSIAPTADGWTVDENDPAKASTTVTVEEAECEIAKPVVVITDSECVEGTASDVTVTITAAPGVTSEYRINDGPWLAYSDPFTASAGDEIDVRHQAPPQYTFPNGKDTAKHNNLVVNDPGCEPEVEVVTPVLPTFTTCPVTSVLPDGVTKVDGSENVYENATAFYEVNKDNITIYPKSGVEFAESDDYTIGDDGSIVEAFPAEGDCPTDTPKLAFTGADVDISGGVLATVLLFGLGGLLLALRKRRPEASNQEA